MNNNAAAHAAFAPVPAACSCGATDLNGCFCGTTPSDWAAAARITEEIPVTVRTFTDSLGVVIETGDRVVINAWGGSVRADDVRAEGLVTGFARTRVRVSWDRRTDAPKPNIDPAFIGVRRRDGEPGLEGNRKPAHVPTYEADYGVRFVCSCGEVSRYWSTRKAAEEMHGYHAHPETAPAPRPGTTVLEAAR